MRPCATLNAVLCGLALVTTAFVACSSQAPPPVPPPLPDSTSGAAVADPPAPLGTAPGASSEPAPPPAATEKRKPETAGDCKELLSEITNEPPDGGVVMNNAMTAADAGGSDRMQPMMDLIRGKRDAFRCCFDIWARKNPGAQGRVVMKFDLDPAGALKKAYVDQQASGVHAPDVESCMVDLAKTLTYPKSPSGKDTTVTYPFDFKARN